MDADEVGSEGWLRAVWAEAAGVDPGPLERATALVEAGLVGLDRLLVVTAVEAAAGVDLPADLLDELRTVDDLLHYVVTLRAHAP